MTASPIKTGFTLAVCCLMVLNNPGAAQACWLTDWLWGNDTEVYPVQPPVISTGYPVYPTTVNYAPAQGGCQPSVVGSYPVTTAGYAPQMNYDSRYQQVPVTVYRPTTVYQPTPGGVPVVGYQGCTTSRYDVQRIPAMGNAPAQSGCGGCGTAGYAAPAPTVQQGQPTPWVPRDQASGGAISPSQIQMPPPPATMPSGGAFPAESQYQGGGPSYGQSGASLAPGGGGSRFSNPQSSEPANSNPMLPPNASPMAQPNAGASMGPAPMSNYVSPSITSQRPTTTTVTPSSTTQPPTNPWHSTPVTPIPNPQFSNSGSKDEAPRLLDPRDKTAGLDTRSTIVPVGYQMEMQAPQRNYRPPTASIQMDANGWQAPSR